MHMQATCHVFVYVYVIALRCTTWKLVCLHCVGRKIVRSVPGARPASLKLGCPRMCRDLRPRAAAAVERRGLETSG